MIDLARRMRIGDLLTGVVVTPRWAERFARDFRVGPGGEVPLGSWEDEGVWLEEAQGPWALDARVSREGHPALSERTILDNGAFPAFERGLGRLPLAEQLGGVHEAMASIGPLVEWIVAPDVVGDGAASRSRTEASLPELEGYGLGRLLIALQEGTDFGWALGLARELGAGVFIGGATDGFKVRALGLIESMGGARWVHVGRVNRFDMFDVCARSAADSCDTSSLLRGQAHNVSRRAHYARWLAEYAWPRSDAGAIPHAPPLAVGRVPVERAGP